MVERSVLGQNPIFKHEGLNMIPKRVISLSKTFMHNLVR